MPARRLPAGAAIWRCLRTFYAHGAADMADHFAVSPFTWIVPELTICVARAAFQLALMFVMR
jgi:hypothetical protein